MAWPTPAQVVNAAGQELGLISWTSPIADPFASTDKNVQQMNALLLKLGQDLARQHPWSQLQLEGSITTVSGVASYPLPTGFLRFVDGTAWNRTTQLPMPSTGPQGWQQVQARTSGGLVNKLMRVYGGAIHLYETPTAAETIYFEYQTGLWLRDTIPAWANNTAYSQNALVRTTTGHVLECISAGTSADSPAVAPTCPFSGPQPDGTAIWENPYPSVDAAPPTGASSDTSTDYLYFDFRLLVDGLKLYFRRAKGLDTTAEQQAYDATLSAVLGGDGIAPVLSLNSGGGSALIGPGNAPEGGYG